MCDAFRRIFLAQAMEHLGRSCAFGWPQCLGVPFGTVGVVNRNEGRFAAHGQAHIICGQIGVNVVAERLDVSPLLVAVRLGDTRCFQNPIDPHGVRELALALFRKAGDRCRRRWFGRARDRDVSFSCEQARCRVETNPASAGQVDFTPGMEVGEVHRRSRRPVERFHVGNELDQITRDKTGCQTEMP